MPPQHPAHQLAAGEQRVQHATGREGADEPAHAHEPELGVDRDLGELRAEGQQPVGAVEGRRAPAPGRLRVGEVVAGQDVAVAVLRAGGRGQDAGGDDRSVLGSAPCSGDPASPTASSTSWERSAVPAACTAELIIPAPAEPTADVAFGRSLSPAWKTTALGSRPERVGGDLRGHRQRAGPELDGRHLHDRAAVGVQARPRPLLGHEERDRVGGRGHAGADQPVPVARGRAGSGRAAPSRSAAPRA